MEITCSFFIGTLSANLTKTVTYKPKKDFSGRTETRDIIIKDKILELFDSIASHLYYQAFINFCACYDDTFDIIKLICGDYSQLEIECVMKGLEVHKNMELKNS